MMRHVAIWGLALAGAMVSALRNNVDLSLAQSPLQEARATRAKSDRLRPILMTTIAMIAGMLPIALELGTGTEILSPMAVAVIGGLVTSTLFTLVVIPAAFTLIDDIQRTAWGWLGKRLPAPDEPGAGAAPAEPTA